MRDKKLTEHRWRCELCMVVFFHTPNFILSYFFTIISSKFLSHFLSLKFLMFEVSFLVFVGECSCVVVVVVVIHIKFSHRKDSPAKCC